MRLDARSAYHLGVGERASDEWLVGATIEGDGSAYAELFDRHVRAVRTTVRGHLRHPDGVEDAVQEAFTRALHRIDTLRDRSRFRPWLLSIARNAATDVRRVETRIDHEQIDEAGGEGLALVHPGEGPEVEVELRELAELVRGGVAGLSPRDATAISMVMWFGFGPQDVAGALGVTEGAAKVLLHRARRRLRDALIVEVAAANRRFGCAELASLVAADDPVAAARHVKKCSQCVEAGRRLLGFEATGPEP